MPITPIPFFNIISGAHEGSRSVVFSTRHLAAPISDITVGMTLAPVAGTDNGYVKASGGDERFSEFVWETDETQSSGTVTTVWGFGEFETNVWDGEVVAGTRNLLTTTGGKLTITSDPSIAKWVVLSKSGNTIRFKTI